MSRKPFSNGTEWDAWSAGWCNRCVQEETCPILDVVFIDELTPTEWVSVDEGALGPRRYTCTAYAPRKVPMSNADKVFWAAFEFDNDTDRWRLAPGLVPMDILVICLAKMEADREAVASVLRAGMG